MLKEQIKQLHEEPQQGEEHQGQQQPTTANKRTGEELGDQGSKRQKGEARRDNNNKQREKRGLPIYSQDPPAVPDCDKLDTCVPEDELRDFLKSG